MPAIVGVAYLYRSFASIDQLELRQEGVVGLLRAAKRYDRTVGAPFWAYASWWVRQAMQQLVAELSGPVVLSDRAARRLVGLKRTRSEYQQRHGREPSLGELADTADLSRHQVENLIAIERAPRGLDERVPGEKATSAAFADGLTDPSADDAYERIDDLIEVEHLPDLTEGLDERERMVVFAHYGIGGPRHTLREIGDGLHLSVERVRQLEERALQKLREAAAWSPDVGHN
jgi:RNA polymerase sigma factor (sigma-70 family)